MENASKALIIAGAILISILLISVGIVIMNALSEPKEVAVDQGAQSAIQMFNGQFDAFNGSNLSYGDAKTCITTVNSTANSAHTVTLNGTITDVSGLTRGKTYDISITDNDNDGFYDQCAISEHTSSRP